MKINGVSYEDEEDLAQAIFFLLNDGRPKRLREFSEILAELIRRVHVLEK